MLPVRKMPARMSAPRFTVDSCYGPLFSIYTSIGSIEMCKPGEPGNHCEGLGAEIARLIVTSCYEHAPELGEVPDLVAQDQFDFADLVPILGQLVTALAPKVSQ